MARFIDDPGLIATACEAASGLGVSYRVFIPMAQRPHDAAVDIIGHAGNALSSIVQVLEAFGPDPSLLACWLDLRGSGAEGQDRSYQERPISTLCFSSSMSNLRWACSRHPLRRPSPLHAVISAGRRGRDGRRPYTADSRHDVAAGVGVAVTAGCALLSQ